MSKFLCSCGHIIVDQTDHLPYKGEILKDEDQEEFWETITKGFTEFLELAVINKRQEWIDKSFGAGYPKDLDNESIISDFLSRTDIQYMVRLYECEICGRLWIQEGTQKNHFVSYSPDDGNLHRILTSEHRNRYKFST